MKKICRMIGVLLSYIVPYKIPHILNALRNAILTGYHSRRFRCFGEGSKMYKPLIIRNLKNVSVGNYSNILPMATITAITDYMGTVYRPSINIGDYSTLGKFIHLTAINSITIGNNVVIGNFVTITDHNHGVTTDLHSLPPEKRQLYSKGRVVIEDNVWVGDKCTILSGVTIGRGSIIGSNTVVTKSVPPYSIVTGAAGSIINIKD